MERKINPRTNRPIAKAWTTNEKIISISIPNQLTKTKKSNLCRRLFIKSWRDEDSTLRRLSTVFILIVYSFLGSAIFYAIERSTNKNFWQCLSYVNSIFTSIGYGQVKPNTDLGKVFTIFYAIMGVPIMMMAASDLGLIIMYWFGKGWVKIRRFRRAVSYRLQNYAVCRKWCRCCIKHNSNVATIKVDDSIYIKGDEESLPLSFAVFTFLLWLLLSSLYFYLSEPSWSFFIAFYFFFISVSTIGLGDYTAREELPQTIADYVFIIGGIALFSLCVRLFVVKVESVDDKVAQSIINEYTSSLEDNYAFDSDSRKMEESESKQRSLIQKMIKKKGGLMRFFIGKRVETKMLREYQKRANMRIKTTQTNMFSRNVAVNVLPMVCDVQTMAGDSFIAKKFIRKKMKKMRQRSYSTGGKARSYT